MSCTLVTLANYLGWNHSVSPLIKLKDVIQRRFLNQGCCEQYQASLQHMVDDIDFILVQMQILHDKFFSYELTEEQKSVELPLTNDMIMSPQDFIILTNKIYFRMLSDIESINSTTLKSPKVKKMLGCPKIERELLSASCFGRDLNLHFGQVRANVFTSSARVEGQDPRLTQRLVTDIAKEIKQGRLDADALRLEVFAHREEDGSLRYVTANNRGYAVLCLAYKYPHRIVPRIFVGSAIKKRLKDVMRGGRLGLCINHPGGFNPKDHRVPSSMIALSPGGEASLKTEEVLLVVETQASREMCLGREHTPITVEDLETYSARLRQMLTTRFAYVLDDGPNAACGLAPISSAQQDQQLNEAEPAVDLAEVSELPIEGVIYADSAPSVSLLSDLTQDSAHEEAIVAGASPKPARKSIEEVPKAAFFAPGSLAASSSSCRAEVIVAQSSSLAAITVSAK